MAVLTQSINDGFAQITTLLKQVNTTLKGNQGDLTKLSTANKTSLVNALNELADKIAASAQANSGLVSASQSQTLTEQQKSQARTNIDAYSKAEIGDITTNFVTTINTTYNS